MRTGKQKPPTANVSTANLGKSRQLTILLIKTINHFMLCNAPQTICMTNIFVERWQVNNDLIYTLITKVDRA